MQLALALDLGSVRPPLAPSPGRSLVRLFDLGG